MTVLGPPIQVIGVTGARNYSDRAYAFSFLDELNMRRGPITDVVHGWARSKRYPVSADTLADDWADARRIRMWRYPAEWSDLTHPGARIKTLSSGRQYDAMAGPRRNQEMVNYLVRRRDRCFEGIALVAFVGNTGTADMVDRCRLARIEIIDATPERMWTKQSALFG